MKYIVMFFVVMTVHFTGLAQQSIKLNFIKDFVGDSVRVCGKVESARYMKAMDDSITVINLGAKYPDQLLTIVIWRQHRSQFAGLPEIDWVGKQVCVTGKVQMYRGSPEIVLKQTSQIEVQE